MTTWQAFFLGIIQGLTEFLPVSSSGHLALGQYFFGLEHLQHFILFNLVCHLGTLGAIFYFFSSAVKESLNFRSKRFLQILIATLPLFPLVLILKPLKTLFDIPELLGPCFLITACLLFASIHYRFPAKDLSWKKQWRDPLIIGIFQAAAIFPGISRSGATISAARFLGWEKEHAIQFSFLLAIPAILGGTVLESWQAWKMPAENFHALPIETFIVGFLTSFLVGCFSLRLLLRLMIQNRWNYFAWYCLILGIFTTFYFNAWVQNAA